MSNPSTPAIPTAPPRGQAMVIFECLEAYRRHKADPDRPRSERRLIDPTKYVPPGAAEVVDNLVSDPTRAALRGMVREMGWAAFTKGGTAAMRQLAEQVDGLASDSWPIGILDKWFDQIGSGSDRWAA